MLGETKLGVSTADKLIMDLNENKLLIKILFLVREIDISGVAWMYLVVIILSVLFVLASVFFPITVYSRSDLAQVEMSLPLAYIIQQQTYAPSFPWQTHLYSIWENPTKILWLHFFVNIAIIFGVFSLVLILVKEIFLRTNQR